MKLLGGHSSAPPLRPAPPFRTLQPCRITQNSGDFREETGGGEGEVPRGAVYRARPSHPGVPVGNHEWEPREAPTLHREPNGQRLHFPPRPLGVTAAARLSRRGRHREQRARVPGSSRTEPAASARPCVAFTLRCPAVLGGGPHTSLHPPGLWKPPPNRLAVNKLSPLWRRSTSSRPPRDRRRRRHTPPSAPPGEAVRPWRLCRTSARSPSTAGCPSARATALMPVFSGGEEWPKDRQWVQITLRTCCGARATVVWVPGCILTPAPGSPDS